MKLKCKLVPNTEQMGLQQPFKLSETRTAVDGLATCSKGVVQQPQNTGRRICYLSVGRRTSLCRSIGVGAR